MTGKKAAIVQSNYIPWKGYFDLINMVDEFILYDDVQYTKKDWRNRNKIKTINGLMWLTIPVKTRGKYHQKIKDTVIDYPMWNKKHWHSIASNLSKAKYFRTYKDIFEELYLGSCEKYLSQVNFKFLTAICDILGITTKISWSMDYHLYEKGKTERVIELCKQIGATIYISGPTAKPYTDEEKLQSEGIKLQYINYSRYSEYNQLFPPFEHQVSIIDLILNTGPDASKYMKSFSNSRDTTE
jgi:hypothetical protein